MNEKRFEEPFHVTESDGVPSRVNNLSGVYYAVNDGPTSMAACGLKHEAQYIVDSLNACQNLTAEEKRAMRNLFNLCAGRTQEQIEAAFALYDNREKVVALLKKANLIIQQNNKASGNYTSHARGCKCGGKNRLEDMTCTEITVGFVELESEITAALALLAEKELSK